MSFIDGVRKNKNRDFSLEVLRAFACIMVMGVHVSQRFTIPGAIGSFFEKGSTGVSFFFILSGYLAYVSLEKLFSSEKSIKDICVKFWLSRAAHILPLYYLIILFYFLFYTFSDNVPVDASGLYWLRYIFMMNLWIPSGNDFWINLGAVWSISVFVLFYFLAPFFYVTIKKYYVAFAGVGITYVLYKVTENYGTGRMPLRFMFYFLLGITIYLAEKEGKEYSIAAILILAILFFFLVGSGTAIISPFLAGLYVVITRKIKPTIGRDGIVYKTVTFISTISYSLYLIHVAVLLTLDEIFSQSGVLYFIIFIVVTVIISYYSYVFVETELARKIKSIRS